MKCKPEKSKEFSSPKDEQQALNTSSSMFYQTFHHTSSFGDTIKLLGEVLRKTVNNVL